MRFMILCLALMPSAAMADSGAQIPEPSNLTLFAMGLAGLIIGRQAAKRTRRHDDD